jgi:hypothetical protein
LGVRATGSDGASFDGVVEYYYATPASDKEGYPKRESYDTDEKWLENWETAIENTLFGTKNDGGITYKYLWNVEGVKTKTIDKKGNETVSITYTNPDLMDIFIEGRIPEEYKSYYAGNTSADIPGTPPSLSDDGNSIVEGYGWDDNAINADANTYLFEVTFVKYKDKDENGQNQWAKLSDPVLIGRNGTDGLSLTLDNDFDTIVRRADGVFVGTWPTTQATVTRNSSKIDVEVELISTPKDFVKNTHYTYDNGKLTLIGLPEDFEQDNFVF